MRTLAAIALVLAVLGCSTIPLDSPSPAGKPADGVGGRVIGEAEEFEGIFRFADGLGPVAGPIEGDGEVQRAAIPRDHGVSRREDANEVVDGRTPGEVVNGTDGSYREWREDACLI